MSKTEGFCAIFFGRVHPSQGKRGSSVKIWVFFCVFGGPETVLKTVLTIRFASYGRFFERGKMSENRQKTSKTGGVLAIFSCSKQPSAGIRLSSVKNWGFFAILVCPNLCSRFVLPHTVKSRSALFTVQA